MTSTLHITGATTIREMIIRKQSLRGHNWFRRAFRLNQKEVVGLWKTEDTVFAHLRRHPELDELLVLDIQGFNLVELEPGIDKSDITTIFSDGEYFRHGKDIVSFDNCGDSEDLSWQHGLGPLAVNIHAGWCRYIRHIEASLKWM